jgi:hypothetical protein
VDIDRIMSGYVDNRLVATETPTGEFSGFDVAFGGV